MKVVFGVQAKISEMAWHDYQGLRFLEYSIALALINYSYVLYLTSNVSQL